MTAAAATNPRLWILRLSMIFSENRFPPSDQVQGHAFPDRALKPAAKVAPMTKTTLGKLGADAFGMLDLPALPADLLAGFRALPDLTGIASDAMDELGIVGAVPA